MQGRKPLIESKMQHKVLIFYTKILEIKIIKTFFNYNI